MILIGLTSESVTWLCESTIVSEFAVQTYILIVLRSSPKLFLTKSRLRRTYDPLFIQTENLNESSVILFWYCGESMRLI